MQRRDLLRGGAIGLTLTIAGCTSGDTEDVEDNSSGNGNGNGDTEDASDDEDGNGNESADEGNTSDELSDEENDTEGTDGNESGGEGLSDNDSEGEESNDSDDSGEESDGDGEDGVSGEPAIETVAEELVVEEGEYSTEAYVDATVENSGDAASGMIELTADWYDGEENFLDNDTTYLQTLPAGEVWNAHVQYLGSEPEAVESYELNGEFTVEPVDFEPEGLELVDDELLASEDEVQVRGEVENNTGGEADYIQAIATFYNAEGEIIGDDWTNVTGVPDGETWSFEVTMLERRRFDEVEDYEVRIADSAW